MATELRDILKNLQDQITQLTIQQEALKPTQLVEHQALTFTVTNPENISLHLFKTLPEFPGDRKIYATWRNITNTTMDLLRNHKTSIQYCQALIIIRNKITGAASNILNNYNTPFNYDAIIDRLDFTYADKRPLYALEQELLVLQQGRLSFDDFYDLVNEKLNAIVNKINMTYKEPTTVKAFIESINEKALRTFTTGLNNRRGEILYASNPSSLPEAYARLQTIITDQERITFANRYNGHPEPPKKNPRFRYQEKFTNKTEEKKEESGVEPMEIDKSSTYVNVDRQSNRQSNRQFPQPIQPIQSTNSDAFKRNFSRRGTFENSTSEQKMKQQRINNMEESEAYVKTIIDDNNIDEMSETESCSTSSIFLEE